MSLIIPLFVTELYIITYRRKNFQQKQQTCTRQSCLHELNLYKQNSMNPRDGCVRVCMFVNN
jgi:hypothetical protein